MNWTWLLHPFHLDLWAYLGASAATTFLGLQLAALLHSNDEDQK